MMTGVEAMMAGIRGCSGTTRNEKTRIHTTPHWSELGGSSFGNVRLRYT
jgi:hypothetical protein